MTGWRKTVGGSGTRVCSFVADSFPVLSFSRVNCLPVKRIFKSSFQNLELNIYFVYIWGEHLKGRAYAGACTHTHTCTHAQPLWTVLCLYLATPNLETTPCWNNKDKKNVRYLGIQTSCRKIGKRSAYCKVTEQACSKTENWRFLYASQIQHTPKFFGIPKFQKKWLLLLNST